MAVCTFFGHRDVSDDIRPKLTAVVRQLIEQDGIREFYVGDHGCFDRMAASVLRKLSQEYPQMRFSIVLSRMPRGIPYLDNDENTLFPEEVAAAMPRFAILARNRWMLEHADVVVTYVTHSMGGAGRFKEMAEKKHKRVINLPDLQ